MDNKPINKEMTLGEVISKYPQTAEIMFKYGLHCIGCHTAITETIEQGAKGHGLTDDEISDMVLEMNHIAVESPANDDVNEEDDEEDDDYEEEE